MNQKRLLFIIAVAHLLFNPLFLTSSKVEASEATGRILAHQATKSQQLWITANHSEFDILQEDFESGPEVTEACLYCHNQAARQFHKTIHWTWMDPITEKSIKLGKGGLSINNF